jgi:putative DNA-invertase from lambdoid prophage Rac
MGQRIAIYCRVSTAEQSCDRQASELLEYAVRAGSSVIGVFQESASGIKARRRQREAVIKLARGRHIDAVLVTEMSRWGRSATDLIASLGVLEGFGVSVIAVTGRLQFDLSTPHGKLIASVLASVAEFERDLMSERICSGLALARSRGVVLGRAVGFRPSDKKESRVLSLSKAGLSQRRIARAVGLSKTTVGLILARQAGEGCDVVAVKRYEVVREFGVYGGDVEGDVDPVGRGESS